jgi:membrane protein implicated in regulation of membrane protease activity
MAEDQESKATPIGLYDRPEPPSVTAIEIIAVSLSLLWLLGAVVFFMVLEPNTENLDGVRFMVTLLAVFLPVAMIWVAAMVARSSRQMREEGQRLNAAIEALRQSYVSQSQGTGRVALEPTISKKLDEIAAAQRKTETAIAMFSTTRETHAARVVAVPQPEPEDDQGLLALGTPAEDLDPPLERSDFIRALHFPETAEDQDGFNALRRALRDRQASKLIQAAQDVLTLLSQDGIYMDDLRPDLARPEIWRQFAEGTRGREIAALGGVRDRSSLALAAGRMKQDPIFRDAAHHFLRRFDKSFVEFEKSASDADITALSETRTARAFMLLGRVAGIFD